MSSSDGPSSSLSGAQRKGESLPPSRRSKSRKDRENRGDNKSKARMRAKNSDKNNDNDNTDRESTDTTTNTKKASGSANGTKVTKTSSRKSLSGYGSTSNGYGSNARSKRGSIMSSSSSSSGGDKNKKKRPRGNKSGSGPSTATSTYHRTSTNHNRRKEKDDDDEEEVEDKATRNSRKRDIKRQEKAQKAKEAYVAAYSNASPLEQHIQCILDANGVTREEYRNVPDQVEQLEIFQQPKFKQIMGFTRFTGLKHLEIIMQNMTKIQGLETLVNLEKIWLSHNRISKIEGLSKCTKLKELYIDSNKLTKIEGLDTLQSLKVLVLHSNQITHIENLKALTSVRKLSLARNKIHEIGSSLDRLGSLQELNLAGNLIGSFSEIRRLTHLKSLQVLYFNDPHFGDNPVCNLCNYHTYALFHLQFLDILDSIRLSEEATQLAEATFLKKQMYYNMRIKMCKRNTTNLLRKGAETCRERLRHLDGKKKQLMRQLKAVERKVEEQEHQPVFHELLKKHNDDASGKAGGSGDEKDGGMSSKISHVLLTKKRDRILSTLKKLERMSREVQELKDNFQQSMTRCSEEAITRMIIELETGGNIRFEDGRSTDSWYNSCIQFLKSHFDKHAFKTRYGVTGLRVRRITKIHNRFLRNRFEDSLENMEQFEPTNANRQKPDLQYLFYSNASDISAGSLEMGFTNVGTAVSAGRNGKSKGGDGGGNSDDEEAAQADEQPALVLSNVVGVNHIASIEQHIYRNKMRELEVEGSERHSSIDNKGGNEDKDVFEAIPAQLVISKIFLGDTCQIRGKDRSSGSSSYERMMSGGLGTGSSGKDDSGDDKVGTGSGTDADGKGKAGKKTHIHRNEYKNANTVIQNFEMQQLFNDGHIYPSTSPSASSSSSSSSNAPLAPHLYYAFERHLILPEYIVSFDYIRPTSSAQASSSSSSSLSASSIELDAEVTKMVGNFISLKSPLVEFTTSFRQLMHRQAAMDDSDKVLKMQPILPQRSSFTWNDVPSMLPSMQPQLRKLTYLNLHDCRLTMIQNLESLTSLRHLILTFNNIALIQGLSTLLQLEHLDLGYNDIRKIAGLSGLHALAHLSVNNNSVQSLKDLELLHTSVPKLRVLDVRGNTQLAHSKGYRSVIISQFDELEMLDGLMVEAKERKQAARTTSNFITVDTLKEHSFLDHESSKRYRHFIGKGSDKPLSYYSRLRVNEVLEATGGNPVSNNNNNNYIGDAPLRGSPSSQVTAGLSSDDMETLKYLRNNWEESVVELELDHQRIGQICNIARLVSLRKASFCNNELKKIEGLDNNLRLEELCLEDNRITVLENLSHLKKLLKLDLGKNQISMVENLSSLEQLTQLSLEDNYISSLKGLESLTSLMELYLGNNRITTLKEINYIRALPKLLILDLSGNPVCKQKEYRSYIIYNLKKLKVLDGIGIDANEQQQAKEMFAGKLTEDLLNEILGHSYYEHIENLDLSNSGIRMMDVVTAERFSKLRVLVLDDNQISDVTSLGSLPLLRVLRLNKNRIASIPLDSDGGGGQGYLARCFPGLEVLELGNNRISSIAALNLKGMTDLRVLTLESNYIQRVDGLQGLPCLQQLVLAKNKIKRLDPRSFYGLNELRGLQLEENGLRSLAHCGPLPKVRSLFLAYNRLSEMSELEYLTPERGCGSVTEITLRNNPLARKQLYRSTLIRKIPSLKIIDGKEIKFEEREKSEALFTAADNNSHYQSNMYFYSNSNVSDPRHHTDKVPIKLQSFTLAGFSLDGPSVSQSPYAHSVHPNHNQHKLAYNGGGGNGKIGVYNSGPRHSHSKSMNHGHAHGRIVDQKNVNSMNGMHHGGMNMSSMNMSKQYRSGMMSRNGAGIAGIQSKNYGANGGGNSKYGNGRMNNFGGMVNKSRYTSTRL